MENKIITLITGATRGMGRETAKELAAARQTVIIGARQIEAGQKVADGILKKGGQAVVVQLDVTDDASVKAAVTTITKRFGKLNILINNAGISGDAHRAPSNLPLEVIEQDFEVNFFGMVRVTQAMLPLLAISDQAKIINISSMMGSFEAATNPKSSLYKVTAAGYQASKAAMNMYSIKLAQELTQNPGTITVNQVDPGLVASGFAGAPAGAALLIGGKAVKHGVRRAVQLATDWNNQETMTFSNDKGPVAW